MSTNIRYTLRKVHYTFDFEQSVQLPYNTEHQWAAFYKIGRKLHIFRLQYDGVKQQRNDCVDEAKYMEPHGEGTHGCNTAEVAGDRDTAATFMAVVDNCNSKQEQDGAVLTYLAWRTWNMRHDYIDIKI